MTGLTAIIRSRTVQAKNAESESRNRFTDDSASPPRSSAMSTRLTSRSVTARTCITASEVGTSRGRAASDLYVLADTACCRSSNQIGSKVRTVARPARGSMPPASAARSLASHACASRLVLNVRPLTYARPDFSTANHCPEGCFRMVKRRPVAATRRRRLAGSGDVRCEPRDSGANADRSPPAQSRPVHLQQGCDLRGRRRLGDIDDQRVPS